MVIVWEHLKTVRYPETSFVLNIRFCEFVNGRQGGEKFLLNLFRCCYSPMLVIIVYLCISHG